MNDLPRQLCLRSLARRFNLGVLRNNPEADVSPLSLTVSASNTIKLESSAYDSYTAATDPTDAVYAAADEYEYVKVGVQKGNSDANDALGENYGAAITFQAGRASHGGIHHHTEDNASALYLNNDTDNNNVDYDNDEGAVQCSDTTYAVPSTFHKAGDAELYSGYAGIELQQYTADVGQTTRKPTVGNSKGGDKPARGMSLDADGDGHSSKFQRQDSFC